MSEDTQVVAITDYLPEDYATIYALSPNGGGMEKSFDDWKQKSDALAAEYRARGFEVLRVLIDPNEFVAWLASNKLNSTEKSRAEFCHHVASRKYAH